MRAIILAAGEGQRLRPLTSDRPKCLVEYQGKPILDYVLEVMRGCGIEDIVIIKGYRQDAIDKPGTRTVINEEYSSTNMVHTFFCAEEYFDDDLIISYGDIIYEPSILEALIRSPHEFAVAISENWRELWQKRMPDPLQDAETLKLSTEGDILELGKKPRSYDEIEGQYMGLFKIERETVQKMKEFYANMDRSAVYDGKDFRNMYMTSFIQAMIDQGFPVKAVKTSGEWLEIDAVDDLKVPLEYMAT